MSADASMAAVLADTKLSWHADTAAEMMQELLEAEDGVTLQELRDRVEVSKTKQYNILRLLKEYGLVEGGRGRRPNYTVTDRGRRWLDEVNA